MFLQVPPFWHGFLSQGYTAEKENHHNCNWFLIRCLAESRYPHFFKNFPQVNFRVRKLVSRYKYSMKFACCLRVLMENKWDVLIPSKWVLYIHKAKGGGGGGQRMTWSSIDLLITLTKSKELLFSHSSYRNWPIFHYSHDQVNTIICRVCR